MLLFPCPWDGATDISEIRFLISVTCIKQVSREAYYYNVNVMQVLVPIIDLDIFFRFIFVPKCDSFHVVFRDLVEDFIIKVVIYIIFFLSGCVKSNNIAPTTLVVRTTFCHRPFPWVRESVSVMIILICMEEYVTICWFTTVLVALDHLYSH